MTTIAKGSCVRSHIATKHPVQLQSIWINRADGQASGKKRQ